MSNQARRLTPAQIQADKDAFAALQSLTDYAPANPNYALSEVASALTSLTSAQQAEAQAVAAAATARQCCGGRVGVS
jgi:hypothetical protein